MKRECQKLHILQAAAAAVIIYRYVKILKNGSWGKIGERMQKNIILAVVLAVFGAVNANAAPFSCSANPSARRCVSTDATECGKHCLSMGANQDVSHCFALNSGGYQCTCGSAATGVAPTGSSR